MGKAKPVDLGLIQFSSQADAEQFFREMLRRYSNEDHVSKDHSRHLIALLARHPSAEKKVGPGIVGFFVRKNPHYHQNEFWIDRIDGSQIGFSYLKCVRGG
jgi:hypothetical protein|tara:strand:- start:5333 stop:5635 length:303 start_codon:yes stop_codon:yes gene_type:complete